MGLDAFLSLKLGSQYSLVLNAVLALSTLFTILLVTLPARYNKIEHAAVRYIDGDGKELERIPAGGDESMKTKVGNAVQIVVLGDIGRSPRMQYHALSIAKHGGKVFLIGYQESEIHPDIVSSPWIKIIPLSPAPSFLRSSSKLLFPVIAPLKALWQAASLYFALGYSSQPCAFMFVQNPPSIPTLAIASLVCFLRNTALVIDWHNFGYSILALKLGPTHPLVRISEAYEKFFAKFATHHITVTHAMARVLKDDYHVSARALHDRPASLFRPISASEREAFLARLPEASPHASDLTSPTSKTPRKLIVSSTSWTADEDFSLLLSALVTYSSRATTTHPSLPRLLAIITGKGPQKEHYLRQIATLTTAKKLENVDIKTAWLTPRDYALLLASAHLGISLHTSSSGVDLPMKVVDMFGAGLPVVGWGEFEAWPELVKEDVNGKGFGSAEQLAAQLVELFGSKAGLLEELKKGAVKESEFRWEEEWDGVGRGVFCR